MAEGDIAPVVETPVVPVVEAPVVVPPAEGVPAASTPATIVEPAVVAPVDPAWVAPRIDRLTKDKKIAEEKATALEARLRAAGIDPDAPLMPVPPVGTVPPVVAPVFDAAEIDRRANVIADERSFTNQCNSIAAEGNKTHTDFKESMARFNLIGGLQKDLIEAAVEVGNPHEILYSLGKNLDEAQRIMGLAPAARGVALAKFASEGMKRAAATVSSAPAPAESEVGGGSPPSSDEPSAKDPSDEWFAKREKQLGIR